MLVAITWENPEGLAPHEKTNALIGLLKDNVKFNELAGDELRLLKIRDREDGIKLKRGIDISRTKNILDNYERAANWKPVYVDHKSPGQISGEILTELNGDNGKVILICGDSGVGKGTLVKVLAAALGNAKIWSNGDIFRAVTYSVLNDLSSGNLNPAAIDFSEYFGKLRIDGESVYLKIGGEEKDLEEIKNGTLKNKEVNLNLPKIAEYTQGEVIKFANEFIKANAGINLLIEGRKETLNYIDGNEHFELKIRNSVELGKRRAAQRVLDFLANGDSGRYADIGSIVNKLHEEMFGPQ